MSEIAAASPVKHFPMPVHWPRAIGAGVIATIVITIVGALLGTNFLKMLGSMIVPGASLAVQYTIGGVMHFMIGIIYGIIYAALVARLVEWNRVVKGAVYGLAIAAIAFAAMPVMSAMMGGGGKAAGNPCQSQSAQKMAMNPCHPSGATAPYQQASGFNPCHTKSSGGGNPCNPCGGGGGPWSGVFSVVNHLVYGPALAFAYGKVR